MLVPIRRIPSHYITSIKVGEVWRNSNRQNSLDLSVLQDEFHTLLLLDGFLLLEFLGRLHRLSLLLGLCWVSLFFFYLLFFESSFCWCLFLFFGVTVEYVVDL